MHAGGAKAINAPMLTVLDVRQQEPFGPETDPLRLRGDVAAILAALCHSSLGKDYSVQDYIPQAGLSVMAVLKVGTFSLYHDSLHFDGCVS